MFNRYVDTSTSIRFPEKLEIKDSRTNAEYLRLIKDIKDEVEKSIIGTVRLEDNPLWNLSITAIEDPFDFYGNTILWVLRNSRGHLQGKANLVPYKSFDSNVELVAQSMATEITKHLLLQLRGHSDIAKIFENKRRSE